ncbi:unnamed protein product [Orchesella dallaii]|uniref:Uncharacterized protein n=1 Tax=Orchesella dallaii TaxID=48710 RepID=A0ABP1PJX8_9HEXA
MALRRLSSVGKKMGQDEEYRSCNDVPIPPPPAPAKRMNGPPPPVKKKNRYSSSDPFGVVAITEGNKENSSSGKSLLQTTYEGIAKWKEKAHHPHHHGGGILEMDTQVACHCHHFEPGPSIAAESNILIVNY